MTNAPFALARLVPDSPARPRDCRIRARRRLAMVVAASVAAIAAGCSSSMYQGTTQAPTHHVDVYRAESEIVRAHEVMGVVKTNAADFMSAQAIEMELVNQAMHCGADAIIVDSVIEETIGYRIDDPSSGSSAYVKAGATPAAANGTAIREKVASARLVKYTS